MWKSDRFTFDKKTLKHEVLTKHTQFNVIIANRYSEKLSNV